MKTVLTVALFALSLAASPVLAQDDAPEPAKRSTDWLHKAKWGVMYHYCSSWKGLGAPDKWNATIDAFDVKGLAKQLHEVGAGYFMITIKHCGNPLAPNAFFEKENPGKCPKRDLIMDLADELAKHDIPLMLYFATGMGVTPDSAQKTAAVIEEYSKRYGKKVRGWWLDNNVGDQAKQKLIADAVRAGNPDSLVAFSPPKGVRRNSPFEDFTAGNVHAPGSAGCGGRFVNGAQWHMLSYIGSNWGGCCKNPRAPRFGPDKVAGITAKCTKPGGVVTWDVPHEVSGLIMEPYLPHLKAIAAAAGTSKKEQSPVTSDK